MAIGIYTYTLIAGKQTNNIICIELFLQFDLSAEPAVTGQCLTSAQEWNS